MAAQRPGRAAGGLNPDLERRLLLSGDPWSGCKGSNAPAHDSPAAWPSTTGKATGPSLPFTLSEADVLVATETSREAKPCSVLCLRGLGAAQAGEPFMMQNMENTSITPSACSVQRIPEHPATAMLPAGGRGGSGRALQAPGQEMLCRGDDTEMQNPDWPLPHPPAHLPACGDE